MSSLYWDDFERRMTETVEDLKAGQEPPVRRVAVFVTNRCNFKCSYCNHGQNPVTMTEDVFRAIVDQFGDQAIIHITGGEPSCVPWLYRTLEELGDKYRFHLNTNAFVVPPAKSVKRLKVSLDSVYPADWDRIVGHVGAWDRVVSNIQRASQDTVTSITYTLSHDNFRDAPLFASFAKAMFPDLYAVFFSVYKGTDPRFVLTKEDVEEFFSIVRPELLESLDAESKELLLETIDEKKRLMQGTRFESCPGPCFLSLSERVFSPDGSMSSCSHLYRDGIMSDPGQKHEKCLYGCNQRLATFNRQVALLLQGVVHL